MIEQAEVEQSHWPPPTGPPTPADAADIIRRLVVAPDALTTEQILCEVPELVHPGLVRLLLDRARIQSSKGLQAGAEHLVGVAAAVAGTTDRQLLETMAALSGADERLTATPRPAPETVTVVAALVRRSATLLLARLPDCPLRAGFDARLYDLVATAASRCEELEGGLGWAELAVEAGRRALAGSGVSDGEQAVLLGKLSRHLARLHAFTGDPAALDEAISMAQAAVDGTPEGDPRRAVRLHNLSNRLYTRYEATGELGHLDAAVAASRSAMTFVALDDPNIDLIRQNLLNLLTVAANGPEAVAGGELGAAGSATPTPLPTEPGDPVAAARHALRWAGPYHRDKADRLNALADALAFSYRRTGNPAELAEAVQVARTTVEATIPGSAAWPGRLSRLGARLTELYRADGDTAHLIEALTAGAEALAATPYNDSRVTVRLKNVVERMGEVIALDLPDADADIEAAEAAATRAVNLTPHGDPDRLHRRALLAFALMARYGGRRARDTGQNLSQARSLVAALPPDSPELADFVARCRRQLAIGPADIAATTDQAALARVMEITTWLDQLETVTPPEPDQSAPASAPAPAPEVVPARAEAGTTAPPDDAARNRHRTSTTAPLPPGPGDRTVRMIQIEIWLLFLIPAGLRIGVIGALGTPSLLWALIIFLVWAITSGIPPYDACRPCHPLRWFLGSFWVVNLISFAMLHRGSVASDEVGNADRYLLSLLAFSGVALMIAEGVHTREQQRRVMRTLVCGVGVMCVIAALQFRLHFDVTKYMERIPGLSAPRALNGVSTRGGFNRPAGTASHPIEYGVTVASTLAIAIHLVVYDLGWPRIRRYLALAVVAFGVPIAVSRSALLVSIPILVVFLVDADRKRRIRALAVLVCLLIVIFIFVPGLIGTLKGYIFAGNSDSSISSRTSDYSAVAPYIRAAPWFGRGPGTFLPRYRILDNQYLLSLVETGAIGLVAMLGLFSLPWWLGSASRSKLVEASDRQLSRMMLAIGMGVILAAATFDATSFPMFMMNVALLVGLSGSHWNRAVYESTPVQPATTVSSIDRRAPLTHTHR